ncbi:Thioredoxin domain-containing protein [Pyrenophora tritici-repentis]|nr:Thioredoxin domain-containing protein [Pyrenophora tritici-repentis]
MRSLLYSLLSLATVASTFAAETPSAKPTAKSDGWDDSVPETTFNGEKVPPMIELTPETFDKEVSKGNWIVEFFSPYCGHCKKFKSTYQTAYEFYYTSTPFLSKDEPEGDSLNSFTRYYDFKFAKVDCVAYADLCKRQDIQNFPSLIYYQDGKNKEKQTGAKELKALSKWIEKLFGNAASRHAEGGWTQASKAPAKVKPSSNANPSGLVEVLTVEKFDKLVTTTLDPWFVKFYAPWCHHCQALAPTWANLARQMKGKLNIGEVNCDVEKKLCKDAKVRGYPTMLFFQGGERIEYGGLRGLGDLLDYAEKASAIGAGVPDVNAQEFKKMEETEEVIFVYFYDHATTSEDFQALERLPLSLVGHAKLVKTNDKAMFERFKISTWPRLMVSRDGKPTYYPPMTPFEMRDVKKVLIWMKTVWLPIVPEMTSSNAREIMDGKMVVLGILNRERSDEFILSKRELKSAALEWIDKQETTYQLERQELRDAKQLRIEEAEDKDDERALRNAKTIRINMDEIPRTQVAFAWVDGIFWERWIRTTYGIDVKDGESVIINDEDNRRYWDKTVSGEPIRLSRAAILETIKMVTANPPKITPKSTTGRFMGTFLSIRHFINGHPFISLGLFVGFFTAMTLFGKSRRRRQFGSTGSYFQLGEKDGLLGGMGNGGFAGGAKHD